MTTSTASAAVAWNGIERGYVPDEPPRIDPAVPLHTAVDTDVDPVTHEVIRYALMNINLEHGELIQQLSLSPIVALARDFGTSLLTGVGELVCVGAGVVYFSDQNSLTVKYILEHRAESLRDGNIFISNDAFIGSSHQSDVTLAAPVFVDDELFCWIANSMHHQDVGGPVPGSQSLAAADAWSEPAHWPPITLVEGGAMRTDVEALFTRQGRYPGFAQMDLRAALGAINATRDKLDALIHRYGPGAVKGVMHRVLDAGEQAFADELRRMPDGRWSHRAFMEGAFPGDREAYAYQVNITKIGDRLIVDNEGTDPQTGAINLTFAGFSGCVKAALTVQILPEMAGAYGGAYRCIEFRPIPGLLNCADYPAAVSPSGAFTVETMMNVASTAVCKMLGGADDAVRDLSLGPTNPGAPALILAGLTASGEQFMLIDANGLMGSLAGRPSRDGIDVGGNWWIPDGSAYNSEDLEAQSPFIVLARELLSVGTDGAGKHRGGTGFRETLLARGILGAEVVVYHNESFARGQGMFGGNPVSLSTCRVKHDSDVIEQAAEGTLLTTIDDIAGTEPTLTFKGPPFAIGDGDVIEWVSPCAAGYADPLLRDPASVLADVTSQMMSAEDAERTFDVVIRDGELDVAATSERRLAARQARLCGREPGEPVPPPDGAPRVGEWLCVLDGRWWCNGTDLGAASANYKDAAVVLERPVRELGPEFSCTDEDMADRFVFREFICPVTGFRIDTEIARVRAAAFHDVELFDADQRPLDIDIAVPSESSQGVSA